MKVPAFLEEFAARFKKGPGRVIRLSGRYKLIRILGAGGMGQVWLAEKLGAAGFSKLVAIKTIAKSKLGDPITERMFLDEARLTANLIHPNIVQVYQLSRMRDEVFIVMEHVFGVSLLQLVERAKDRGEFLPLDLVAFVFARTCYGLAYAHQKHSRDGVHLGIVHRDICPTNLLVSFRGIPKLTDFGVAKASTSLVEDEKTTVWGKYPYMSPEAAARKGTDRRSDIYSLGLVMYEAITGRLAHNVDDTKALNTLLSVERPHDLDPRTVVDYCPEGLADIVKKATAADPAARYQTAMEMARDLEQWLLVSFLFPDETRLSDYLAARFPQAQKHRYW
ncbi:MAG TPA: serine/threonine-protein kinase [Planctomycetota bacterium]|nr:serine/threonine-protein kinase [Planctomycetota bacterium]